jgi:acyl carrier protein
MPGKPPHAPTLGRGMARPDRIACAPSARDAGVRREPSAPELLETDTMQRPQLITLFRDLASEIAEKDLSFVREDSAISDMGIDSLAMLELVGTMERELRIRVPDEQLVGLITVGQLLELVEGRITQAA